MTLSQSNVAEKLLTESSDKEDDDKIIDEYVKLNEKCDSVITKIKIRKSKRDKK